MYTLRTKCDYDLYLRLVRIQDYTLLIPSFYQKAARHVIGCGVDGGGAIIVELQA